MEKFHHSGGSISTTQVCITLIIVKSHNSKTLQSTGLHQHFSKEGPHKNADLTKY